MPLKLEDIIIEIRESRHETAEQFKVQGLQLTALETSQARMQQKCEDRCRVVNNLARSVWGDDGGNKGLQRDMDEMRGHVAGLDIRLKKWSRAVWLLFGAACAFFARMAHSFFQGPPA